jgi:hypothetical protein
MHTKANISQHCHHKSDSSYAQSGEVAHISNFRPCHCSSHVLLSIHSSVSAVADLVGQYPSAMVDRYSRNCCNLEQFDLKSELDKRVEKMVHSGQWRGPACESLYQPSGFDPLVGMVGKLR